MQSMLRIAELRYPAELHLVEKMREHPLKRIEAGLNHGLTQ